jgi:hypothetical protein
MQTKICTCAICQADLNAPEFQGVGHRKVLTIARAPEFLCSLCEKDLADTGCFDFESEIQADGNISFDGNKVLHSILSSLRIKSQKGEASSLPGLAMGAYR